MNKEVKCNFCGMLLPSSELKRHKYYCLAGRRLMRRDERKIKEKILTVHELINKVWQKKEQETDKNMQIAYNEQIWYFEGKLDAFRDVLGIDEININKIREELK